MQKTKLFALLGILAVLAILFGCPVQNDDNGTSDQTQTNTSSSSSSSDDSSSSSSSSSDDNHQVQAPALSEFVGSWTSTSGDTYIISNTKFISYPTQNTFGTPSVTWTIQDTTGDGTHDTVLYVYGQVTQANTWTYGNMSGSYGTVGHYSAAYLEKIDADTIKISTAYYDSSTDNVSFDYVKANYTDGNGAFGNKPEYDKVTTKADILNDFIGTWTNAGAGDTFVITETQFKGYSSSDLSQTPNYIWNLCDLSSDTTDNVVYYYIYGQITQANTWTYGNMSGSYGTVGHYSAAYLEKIDADTIKISTAYYDSSTDNVSFDYVKTNYTDGNGAFGNKPEYTKQ